MPQAAEGRNTRLRALALAAALPFAGCADEPPAPEGFEIHPDFEIRRVAAEPLVFDPVDLEFDERGDAYVLEMPGYPFPGEPGRVVRLEDADGDGEYDVRHVFAEGFPVAVSILPWRGGLLVASPPDLVFVRDTDGDGVADERRVELSGFAVENTQHNYNGLTLGLDNLVYGANGGNAGEVFFPESPGERIPLRDEDFRVDLDARRFERIGESSGGFEQSFDSRGRLYGTHNTRHISLLVFPGYYAIDLPGHLHDTREEISDHGEDGPARLYPIGVPETRVNHPEQSGRFSGACGITVYTGGAFGPEYDDQVFVADVVVNVVHRSRVRPSGASAIASRAREGVEFLASSDRAFRPVNMTVGPDGALYLLDMHRAVIEHPEWIPDEIEARLDLDAGRDQGRIYRIAPRGGLPPIRGGLDRDRPDRLVEALGHPNKWWRDTAQRLLLEAPERAPVEALHALLGDPAKPLGRRHALWTLEGLGRLEDRDLRAALADADAGVREQAVRIAEARLSDVPDLSAAVAALIDDPDARVRMQAVLSLGTHPADLPLGALTAAARRDAGDPWLRRAMLTALDARAADGLAALLAGPPLPDPGRELVTELAALVPPADAAPVVARLRHAGWPDAASAAVLEGLAAALETASTRTALAPADAAWLSRQGSAGPGPLRRAAWRAARGFGLPATESQRALLSEAAALASAPARPLPERLEAVALLELAPDAVRVPVLLDLLGPRHPGELQQAALEQLRGTRQPGLGAALLEAWPSLEPRVRDGAVRILLRRKENHALLMDALESGRVTLGELNLDLERRRQLLFWSDPGIRRRAEAFFSDAGVVTREEALARMRPALDLQGDPRAGRAHFAGLCARCHRYGGQGSAVGPDLEGAVHKSAETLLHDIVDPNAATETQWVSYSVETADGRILSGLLRDETDAGLAIVAAGGEVTEVSRDRIERLWTGGLSLMPEELETGLDPQGMADLLAYLRDPS